MQWLTSTFNLTAEDGRHAFSSSCQSGHVSVAQWLTSTFNLTAEDARADDNNYALRMSHFTEYGEMPVSQWLRSTFNLTDEDAIPIDTYNEDLQAWLSD